MGKLRPIRYIPRPGSTGGLMPCVDIQMRGTGGLMPCAETPSIYEPLIGKPSQENGISDLSLYLFGRFSKILYEE